MNTTGREESNTMSDDEESNSLLPHESQAQDGAESAAHVPRRVNVDFPSWMVDALDLQAKKLGITRQSLIKVWIWERLVQEDLDFRP